MLVQLIQAGSPGLKAENPALLSLIAAFFFPVGLLMLVFTGQELLTAHLSTSCPLALVLQPLCSR